MTLSIAAPQHTVYGDGKDPEAVITDEYNIRGGAAVSSYKAIRDGSYYARTGPELPAAPTDAGDYVADIALGKEGDWTVAYVGYTIDGIDPIAAAPKGVTTVYGKTLADVALTNPIDNTEGTWTWADPTASVGSVGEHTFKANFTPKETSIYKSVKDVDVPVKVEKAENPATVKAVAELNTGGNTLDLAENVALNGATDAVSYEIIGESYGCTLNGSILTSGKKYGTVTVNVTVAEDANYHALAATPITVNVWAAYPVWLADTQVTSLNMTDVFGDGKVSFEPADDAASAILTLNDYRFSSAYPSDDYGIQADGMSLAIMLKGSNSIICKGNGKDHTYFCINVYGDLAIFGTGSLTVEARDFAIHCTNNLVFNGLGEINAKGEYRCIFGANKILFSSGNVTAETKSALNSGSAIQASGIEIDKNFGTIRAVVEGPLSVGMWGDYKGGIAIDGADVYVKASGEGSVGIKGKEMVTIGENVKSFIAEGTEQAINGEVVNAVMGYGWNNAEGTGDKENIDVSSEGRSLSYQRVQFPGGFSYPTWMAVSDAIRTLPEPITLADKDAVAAARAAYDALPDAQKALVPAELLKKLTDAEAAIAAAEAEKTSIADCTITAKNRTYTGKALTPKVTVMFGETKLKAGRDYTLSYKKIRKVGTAEVIVNGQGNYAGTGRVTFKVVPQGTRLLKVTGGNDRITVKWKKQNNVAGYQIQYSLNKRFSNGRKRIVGGADVHDATLRNLEAGRKYYVRVRTYKKVKGRNYYSAWSKVKAVRTRGANANSEQIVEAALYVGETLDLNQLVPGANAWESRNEAIATVTEAGVVKALSAGEAEITGLDANGEEITVMLYISDGEVLELGEIELPEGEAGIDEAIAMDEEITLDEAVGLTIG